MELVKAVELDVELDLVGEEGTVPLDADALEKVSDLFANRYPHLYAACGGGLRASHLGRAGLDVALTVTDATGALPAMRTALEAVEDVLSEIGFEIPAADVYGEDEKTGTASAKSGSDEATSGRTASGRARMRLARMEASKSGLGQMEPDASSEGGLG